MKAREIEIDVKETRKTQITIFCRDKSRRVIVSEGIWSTSMAYALGRDLEYENFKYATVSVI